MTRPFLSSLCNGKMTNLAVESKWSQSRNFGFRSTGFFSIHLIWSIADIAISLACIRVDSAVTAGTRHFFVPLCSASLQRRGTRNVDKRLIGYRNFVATKLWLPPRWYIAFNYIRYYERHPTWALQSKIEEFIPGVTAFGEITSRDCRWLKKVSGAHEYSMNFEAAAETSRSRGRVHWNGFSCRWQFMRKLKCLIRRHRRKLRRRKASERYSLRNLRWLLYLLSCDKWNFLKKKKFCNIRILSFLKDFKVSKSIVDLSK